MKLTKKTNETPEDNLPSTPYFNARREWNERYGDYIDNANSWRVGALAAIVCCIILAIGNVYQSTQNKIVPYIVETNAHNEVTRVQRADVAARPTNNQIVATLRNWLIGARTVYVDLRAQQTIVDSTYAATLPDSQAYQSLANYHRENNPYSRAANETVEITVNAVVPVSEESWQIEWTETVRQRSGKIVSTKQWQGTFTIIIVAPTDEAQIMVNPLGVYVRQYAWTIRL